MEKTTQIENLTGLIPGDKALKEFYGDSFREKYASMCVVDTRYGGNVSTTYTDHGPVSESVNYTIDPNGAVTKKSVRALMVRTIQWNIPTLPQAWRNLTGRRREKGMFPLHWKNAITITAS